MAHKKDREEAQKKFQARILAKRALRKEGSTAKRNALKTKIEALKSAAGGTNG